MQWLQSFTQFKALKLPVGIYHFSGHNGGYLSTFKFTYPDFWDRELTELNYSMNAEYFN